MPVDDPTPDLTQIIDLGDLNAVSPTAVRWATSALRQAESILETVASMLENGVPAPTDRQAQALRNIQDAASECLPDQRVIDSFADDLAALRKRRAIQDQQRVAVDRRAKFCPIHNIGLPASGICDDCE